MQFEVLPLLARHADENVIRLFQYPRRTFARTSTIMARISLSVSQVQGNPPDEMSEVRQSTYRVLAVSGCESGGFEERRLTRPGQCRYRARQFEHGQADGERDGYGKVAGETFRSERLRYGDGRAVRCLPVDPVAVGAGFVVRNDPVMIGVCRTDCIVK
jgi:hypothetical protein